MRFQIVVPACSILVLCFHGAYAAPSWSFDDATVSVQGRKTGGSDNSKEKLLPNKPLAAPLGLGPTENLKILLTTKEGSIAKRPHQSFLNLKDPSSGLETSFAFQLKENGKGKLELSQKDVPVQLLTSEEPLSASLFIASFGSSKGYNAQAFKVRITQDPAAPLPSLATPPRYGKLPEIHHIFKSDPRSPPVIISLVFSATVVLAFPALLLAWLSLGANANHLSQALRDAPIPHVLFYGSLIAMEGVFFMYYTYWNLFETLPAALGIGLVTFLSGSRALREVQGRRLGGLR